MRPTTTETFFLFLLELLPRLGGLDRPKRTERIKAKVRAAFQSRCASCGQREGTDRQQCRRRLELHHKQYISTERHLSLGKLRAPLSNKDSVIRRFLERVAAYNSPEHCVLLCSTCHHSKAGGVHTPYKTSQKFIKTGYAPHLSSLN